MSDQSAFIIKSAEGKGVGVFATRHIKKGEEILSERPLFTQTRDLTVATIAQSLALKTAAEQRQYFTLANCYKPSKTNPLLGIFRTNCLPCGANNTVAGDMASSAGIFLQGSRFNSSCVPNANNFWEETRGEILFHAVRDIEPGEELFIAYGQIFEPSDLRKAWLKKSFGFDCKCEACVLKGDAQRASDRRRLALKILFAEIDHYHHWPAQGMRKVKEAYYLLHEEGLTAFGGDFALDAFTFCMAASDLQHAAEWATRWQAMACVMYGQHESRQQFESFGRYLRDPKSHELYGKRPKTVLIGPDD